MLSETELVHLLELKADGDQNQNLDHKRTKPRDHMYRDIVKIMMV